MNRNRDLTTMNAGDVVDLNLNAEVGYYSGLHYPLVILSIIMKIFTVT